MERERERVRAREASSPSPVGFRSWVLLLLFSILLLLFFPLSFRGSRPFAVRNGWDVLNLLLVLFAILCGVLSRRSGGDDADGFPRHAASEEWLGFASRRAHVSYSHRPTEDTPAADVIRMRSDSSYPVQIRPDMAALNSGASSAPAEWHRYDDAQLYRWRLESGGWERERFADFESKTIAVDKYVLRRSPSPRSRSPPSPPSLPPQPNPRWTEVDGIPERELDKDGIFESKKPHLSSSPPPPLQPSQRQPRRRRRRTVEKVSENREVHKDEIFGSDNPHPRSPSPPPLTQRPLRRSMEKYREREVGHNATSETKKTHLLPSLPATSRQRRRRSVGDIPKWEVDQDPNLAVEKPQTPQPASPPLPPLSLPPPPQPQDEEEEEKKNHKKRSGGGTKDIAAAIAFFYPKKKGSKTQKSSNDTTLPCEDPASSGPPPPPPPPPPSASVFHQLFAHKKGGGKNRLMHSDSGSAPPQAPPPPAPARQSRKEVLHSPRPPQPLPPAPPSHNHFHDKGKEKVYPDEPPQPPSSSLPPRPEKSNSSHMHQPVAKEVKQGRRTAEGEAAKFKEREAKESVAVSCPSPDVDNKADLFIAQCRANWKLEKQNSVREKELRKQRKQQLHPAEPKRT